MIQDLQCCDFKLLAEKVDECPFFTLPMDTIINLIIPNLFFLDVIALKNTCKRFHNQSVKLLFDVSKKFINCGKISALKKALSQAQSCEELTYLDLRDGFYKKEGNRLILNAQVRNGLLTNCFLSFLPGPFSYRHPLETNFKGELSKRKDIHGFLLSTNEIRQLNNNLFVRIKYACNEEYLLPVDKADLVNWLEIT